MLKTVTVIVTHEHAVKARQIIDSNVDSNSYLTDCLVATAMKDAGIITPRVLTEIADIGDKEFKLPEFVSSQIRRWFCSRDTPEDYPIFFTLHDVPDECCLGK